MEHLAHWDDVEAVRDTAEGSDIDALWENLGRAAGSATSG